MACVKKRELIGKYAEESTAFLRSVGFVNISSAREGSVWTNKDIEICLSEDCVLQEYKKLLRIVWNTGITIGGKLGEQKVRQKINDKFQNWMNDLN